MERRGVRASQAMILILLFVFTGLLALGLFHLIRGPNLPIRSLAELELQARPVDLEAFKNLIDPKGIEFLRNNLSSRNFSKTEKERRRVALLYLKDIARNCVLLMRIAEAATENPNPDTRIAAKKLSDAALECRILALRQIASLRFALILPVRADQIARSYSTLSSALGRFSMAAEPSLTSRVVASI